MPQRYRSLFVALLLLTTLMPSALVQAAQNTVRAKGITTARKAPALVISVQPRQIEVGRDVHVLIRIADAKGKPVNGALITINGAGLPRIGTAAHGTLTLIVHATAKGTAILLASHGGYAPFSLKLPIVDGSPATVIAIKHGVSILAPKAKPVAGKQGDDLFERYHAVTANGQFASLGLRDGTLMDLNANTDVVVKDPLHTTLNKGELFLEVVHGDTTSHRIQIGTAEAATKGTRLDVRYNPATKIATVTVVEGRVQVSNKGKSVLVGAGQQSSVPANGPPSPPKRVDVSAQLSWLHNLPNTASSAVVPPVLSLPVPPITPIAAPPIAPTPTITITGALETTAWSGVVLVQNAVTIPAGTTVTIQPGTIVEMADGTYLSVAGTLQAQGTVAAPIIVTSADPKPAPDAWDYIDFTGPSANATVMNHVDVFYGGHGGSGGAEVSASGGSSPTISNSVIAQSSGDGLYLDDNSRATVTNCTFAGNTSYAISTSADNSTLISGSSVATGQSGIEVRGGAISHNGTWHAQNAPYVLDGGVTLAAGATLHVDPGTVILMNQGGWLSVSGTLLAQGTQNAPIIVTSVDPQPAPDAWDYIDFTGASANASILDYLQVSYGGHGGSSGAEVSASSGASPTILDSGIIQSSGIGLYVDDSSRAVVSNCIFESNNGVAISAPADDAGLISGTSVAAGQSGIELRGGAIAHSSTWHAQSAPFMPDSNVSINAGVTVTIEPGTLVQPRQGGSISVSGTLLARGLPNDPIVFTSPNPKPAPGDWSYIDFTGTSSSASILDYVQISYGGHGGSSGAEVSASSDASPTITHCVITFSSGDGLYVDNGHPTIAFDLFQHNASHAISIPARDPARVHDNVFAAGQPGMEVRG